MILMVTEKEVTVREYRFRLVQKDRFWDSSKSDEKLVNEEWGLWGYHSVTFNNLVQSRKNAVL